VEEICNATAYHRANIPFEVLQEIEESLYWYHRHLNTTNPNTMAAINVARERLVSCRNQLNADAQYVRYKTLVGFRTIFPEEWDAELSIDEKEKLRTRRMEAYAETVTLATREEWIAALTRCAETQSNDGATFPPLIAFFTRLIEKAPAVGLDIFLSGGSALERFAPGILPTLLSSSARPETLAALQQWISSNRDLSVLARTLFVCDEPHPEIIRSCGSHAVEKRDISGCLEIAHAALKHGDAANRLVTSVFVPTISVLNDCENGSFAMSWLGTGTFDAKLAALPVDAAIVLVTNFRFTKKLDYSALKKLESLVASYPDLIWDLLKSRLEKEGVKSFDDHYDAVPDHWHWHGLETALAREFETAFARVQSWAETPGRITVWRKAELLSGIFHKRSQMLIDGLVRAVTGRGAVAIPIACEILRHFDGIPAIDSALQAMLAACPVDDDLVSEIGVVLDQTGVVSGEFGFANEYEAKFARLQTWQNHPDSKVVAFAQRHMRDLDQRIRDERRRATERHQRRQLDFDGDYEA
jgi:hypothetical protein